jgi:ribonuclease HI
MLLQGYGVYRFDDVSGNRAQGGVAIAVRENIYSSQITLRTPLQAIAVSIATPEIVTFCNVYLPQWAPVNKNALESLAAQLPKPHVLLGDFNAHDSLWGSNRAQGNARGKIIANFINDNNFILLNNGENTRFNSYNGEFSVIDLCFYSCSLGARWQLSVHNDLCGSDHFPIFISKPSRQICDFNGPRTWVIKKGDWPLFRNLFKFTFTGDRNGAENVLTLTKAMLDAAEASVPRASIAARRPPVPWWNTDCAAAIGARKRALKIFQKYPTAMNLAAFRRLRAKARRIIKEAKKASWISYASQINCRTPLSKVWEKVNKIAGNRTSTAVAGLKVGPKIITSRQDVAEAFVEHFAEISSSKNYDQAFISMRRMAEAAPLNFGNKADFPYNEPFNLWELESAIACSKNTAPGGDDIHYAFIRNLPAKAFADLLSTFNQIWCDGSFPDAWRESVVIPVPKQGKDRSDLGSYRPISLTSSLCKIMERMVNRRLVWYLESRGLLSKIQCGFRRNRSTTDHLVRSTNFIHEAFLLRQHVVAVFFDIEKAYDRLWRHKVLKTLHEWGFRGNLLIFIRNFLEERVFRVRVHNFLSSSRTQENGVPQGCILSVTLFAIAINNIEECIKPPVIGSLFVDDLAVFCRSSTLHSATRQIQMTLNRLEKWSNCNGLRFSTEKTKCMHFYRVRGIFPIPSLFLGSKKLPFVQTTRFLGLTFDFRLNWREHISFIRDKCFKNLNIMRVLASTTWGADRTTMLMLYRALVRSKLDYGSVAYSSTRDSYLRPLTSVHNAGLRLATGAFRTSPTTSIYADSGEPPLSIRRNILMCNYAAKILSLKEHPCFNAIFKPRFMDVFNRRTRSTKPLGVRLRNFINEAGFRIPEIILQGCSANPPWVIPRPDVNFSLARGAKSSTLDSEYKLLFKEVLERHPRLIPIYTDGSKSESACACAVIPYGGDTIQTKLSPLCSIYSAELLAIKYALANITLREACLICSDSLSALRAISEYYPSHPLVQSIHDNLYSLRRRGIAISFMWIPGHVGIRGNEMADAAAKEALSTPITDFDRISSDDLRAALRRVCMQQWQELWNNIACNKLRNIKVDTSAWATSARNSRREEVALTRLRIGHTALTHAYLFTEEKIPPYCEDCDSPITVRHLLTVCDKYRALRIRLNIRGDLGHVLGDDPDCVSRIICFLKESGLFNCV